MGAAVGQVVQRRMGRTLLELGGNNAVIVTPSADLDLAVRRVFRRGWDGRPAMHHHAACYRAQIGRGEVS